MREKLMSRKCVRRRRIVPYTTRKEAMSQQEPNANGDIIKDFQSTGRTGRRNAMADVLGAHKDVSTSDLPLKLEKLSTNDDASKETSGVWQEVTDISKDVAKLMLLAKQAHNATLMPENDEIVWATFHESKMLSFYNHNENITKLQPMHIDIVTYAVKRLPKCIFDFTKGIKDNYVLYLVPWDNSYIELF